MKGKLIKTEQGWFVRYRETTPLSITTEILPLHPNSGIPQDAMCDVLDYGFAEIDFEIVHFWENGEVGVTGLTYAKLIQNHQPFIDNRKDKLETLAKLLAKTWFYCDWKWESPNERVMQMLMQDLGLYPFKDEDEMIQQTKIDDGLDKELYKEASRRIPTYGKLSKDLVENKLDLNKIESKIDEALANETPEKLLGWMWKDIEKEDSMNYFICQDPDCPHCIEEINQIQDDDLTDDEWLIKELKKELSTCIACDEEKETHVICMDCIVKTNHEISDEEIEDIAWEKFITNSGRFGFISGAKWYREQLKKK